MGNFTQKDLEWGRSRPVLELQAKQTFGEQHGGRGCGGENTHYLCLIFFLDDKFVLFTLSESQAQIEL